MKEAMFYEKLKDNAVRCQLCPHFCFIKPGKRGICGVRENRKGKLFSLVYGKLCSMGADPIEKKPLFHFASGSRCLSIATVGCNLSCSFCQNWEISHPPDKEIFGEGVTPERVIEMTIKNNLPGIAYTYTEPLIAFEFYIEVMRLAKKQDLYNVWVSNGYVNPEPARKISKYLHAVNVDLKGDPRLYRELCKVPDYNPIKEALKIYRENGVWIEITNLVIPGWNDKDRHFRDLSNWIVENLGEETPLHFSSFYPNYKMMDGEVTPQKTLERAAKIAENSGLKWVYIGNVWGHKKESTYCHKCGELFIERTGFVVRKVREKCSCGEMPVIAGEGWSKI